MIMLPEFLVFLVAVAIPVTYILIIRHYLLQSEAADLAKLARTGPLGPGECCCEQAAKALAGDVAKPAAVAA